MCGRYAITQPPQAMRELLDYPEQPNFPPRYNIAPTQPVPVVRLHEGARQFMLMRWGFIPGWVKDSKDFPLVINIRSESAAEKPSFRNALTRRRCLMPADGFYEWRRSGKENQPYLFRRPDRSLFAFAALWETWHARDGSEIDTVAIMTGPANGLMSAIHHRCPIILDPAQYNAWLDPAATPKDVSSLLKPPPENFLELLTVSPAVNKVANDGPELQEPFDAAKTPAPEKPASGPAMRSRQGGKDDAQGSLF